MKIAIAQFWDSRVSYAPFTEKINKTYCEKHGYIHHVIDDAFHIKEQLEDRAPTWFKPWLILDCFEQHQPDYVLFLDADAIVLDHNRKVEEFIDQNYDITCTQDYGPSVINAGVMLLRNTDWVKEFMKTWWDTSSSVAGPIEHEPRRKGYYKDHIWHDQTCFGLLYNANTHGEKDKIRIIEPYELNSMHEHHPEHNVFVYHAFAQGSLKNRTIDTIYYRMFNIEPPINDSPDLLEMVQDYDTDKQWTHSYIDNVYTNIFNPIKNDNVSIVEIGLRDGESVRLWRDFLPNARIFTTGNQQEIEQFKHKHKTDRITFIECDQSNDDDVDKLNDILKNSGPIDIIIDNGTHKMRDQQITLAKLFDCLKKDGVYILENTHTSYEATLPEKEWLNWGDKSKTLTASMLDTFCDSGTITSDYMTDKEQVFLTNSIAKIYTYKNTEHFSWTSVITKGTDVNSSQNVQSDPVSEPIQPVICFYKNGDVSNETIAYLQRNGFVGPIECFNKK